MQAKYTCNKTTRDVFVVQVPTVHEGRCPYISSCSLMHLQGLSIVSDVSCVDHSVVYPVSIGPLSTLARTSPQCITNASPTTASTYGGLLIAWRQKCCFIFKCSWHIWCHQRTTNGRQSVGWGWGLRLHVVVNTSYSV